MPTKDKWILEKTKYKDQVDALTQCIIYAHTLI